jgi:competence protein ComEA
MRRVTELLRNLLGLDDGATTSLSQLENSPQRVRWRIAVGASIILGVAAIGVAVLASSFTTLGAEKRVPDELLRSPSPATSESGSSRSSEKDIFVHVVGAVRAPGLYALRADARAIDAVMAAGGLAGTANPCAINLAQTLGDGQQIVVPATVDGMPGDDTLCPATTGLLSGSSSTTGGLSSNGLGNTLVSLSTATVADLDTLPGIGPALAQRIVDWREASGGFTSVEQLSEVSGIGDSVMAKIRSLVTL